MMADAGIHIDPTNKNLNLKEEIMKLVNRGQGFDMNKIKKNDDEDTYNDDEAGSDAGY